MKHEGDSNSEKRPIEATEDFDWSAVEDPIGVVLEDFQAMGLELSREQAAKVSQWSMAQERLVPARELAFLELVLGWVGTGNWTMKAAGKATTRPKEDLRDQVLRRLASRAAVAIQELTPHMMGGQSVRELADQLGVSHGEVFRLHQSFRQQVGRPAVPGQREETP